MKNWEYTTTYHTKRVPLNVIRNIVNCVQQQEQLQIWINYIQTNMYSKFKLLLWNIMKWNIWRT